MRWNQRMALTMSLSGMFNTGHDIGGFDGPVPDAELLIRWTQACCLVPRMIMNSLEGRRQRQHAVAAPGGDADHPRRGRAAPEADALPLHAAAGARAREHLPVLRPTFFDFGDDPRLARTTTR